MPAATAGASTRPAGKHQDEDVSVRITHPAGQMNQRKSALGPNFFSQLYRDIRHNTIQHNKTKPAKWP
jgi:hypothetical protein